jgi:predicted ribosome quality control (RQC) complex YloA/Tae2 family protein
VEDVASITRAMAMYESERAPTDAYADARSAVAAELGHDRDKLQRRAAALERQRLAPAEVEALREAGDLLLAYQHLLDPGADRLDVPPSEGCAARSILLDPGLTAVENAQRYYARYRTKKRALEAYDERAEEVRALLDTLDQLETDLALAEDRSGIDATREAHAEAFGRPAAGGRQGANVPRPAVSAAKPLEVYSSDGMRLLVGRNSRQNEELTFRRAARGDLWLHARGVPGGHVVIKAAGRDVPERTVEEAAALAAHYSAARNDQRVDVVVTDIRHVRRMRSAGPGMVTYSRERVLAVRPASPTALGLA